jgi:8-oxo-dGTP pyrophosphatase MutT (NUDIX family)
MGPNFRKPVIFYACMADQGPNRRGVVGVIHRHGELLVIQRSLTVAAPGKFCFPGGGVEGEESEAEALIRELMEELSVAAQPVRRLWRSVTGWGVELAWWEAMLPADAQILPNPAEVASFGWYTPSAMSGLPDLLSSNRDFLHELRSGTFALSKLVE